MILFDKLSKEPFLILNTPTKYLITVFIVGFATYIQWILYPLIEPSPFILYYPAIILAALYGDGISAALLSAVAAQIFFVEPKYSLHLNWPEDVMRQSIFLISGLMIRFITSRLAKALENSSKERQQALEAKEWFSKTLLCIGDAVIATDKEGRIAIMNPIAEQLTQWTMQEAKGKKLSEVFYIINQDSRKIVDNPVGKVLETGTIVGLANHTILIGRQGREVAIEDSAAPIRFDKNSDIQGVVLVFRDITEKYEQEKNLADKSKQIQSSEARFRAVIDNALDAVVGMNDEGIITHWNFQAERIFGYSREEAVGRRMSETIIPHKYRDDHENGMRHYLASGEGPVLNKRFEITAINREGTEFPIELSITPLKIEDQLFFAGFIRNISEQNRMSRDLILKSEALENSLNGFDIVNSKGEFIYANRAYLDMWGFEDASEIIGTSPASHCQDPETPAKIIGMLKKSGECDLEFVAKRKDGSTFDVRMLARVARDAEGNEVYPTTSIDITEKKQAEEKIKESEEQFRSLANSMPQLCWMADSEGWIYWYNDRWYEYTGTTLEEMQGWGWQKVHHPDHLAKVVDFVKTAWHIPKAFELTFPLRDKFGNYRWFLTKMVPVKDSRGNIQRWFGTNTDIQEQKEVEEALSKATQEAKENLKKLDAVVHNLSEGLIFSNPQGLLLSMNPEALRIHQFGKLDDMLGKLSEYPDLFVLHSVDGKELPLEDWPLSRVLKGEKFTQYEVELYRKDNRSTLIASYGGTPLFDEEGILILAVLTVRDVTQKKRTEQELKEAIRVRDEFLSVASHELKTPLTSLTLQGQIRSRQIAKGHVEQFTIDNIAKMFESDLKQLRRLNRLIDDMLDISRLRTGKLLLTKEPINLCLLVEEVIERHKPQFIESSIELTFKPCKETFILGDSFRLEQVITNLLTNALKYGNRKPVIFEISQNKQKAYLSITDQGLGITKDDQQRIFSAFERAVSANEISGLGLGLAIVSDIVEAHGGQISVESDIGKGSKFIVELPLSSI